MKIFKKKKTAAAVVSAVAAASVLVSAAFTAPEDVFTDPDSNHSSAVRESGRHYWDGWPHGRPVPIP